MNFEIKVEGLDGLADTMQQAIDGTELDLECPECETPLKATYDDFTAGKSSTCKGCGVTIQLKAEE